MASERPNIILTMPPVAYSPETFGAAYCISRSKLYAEIRAGRLIARKLGNRTIILAQDAEEWAQSLPRLGRGNERGND